MVRLVWDAAEPQLPSELTMSFVAVLYPVLGKEGFAQHSWLSLIWRKLHCLSQRKSHRLSFVTRKGFDSEISAQCRLEMGQLVLFSSLSSLMPGGRKFKSGDTGCTVFSRQDIEKAMGKSTKKKGQQE